MRSIPGLAAALALVSLAGASARTLHASAPIYDRIPLARLQAQGIAPFLQSNPAYSTFLDLVAFDATFGAQLANEWSQGPTNNTVLAPTNEAIDAGLQQLEAVYGIPGNATVLLTLADESGELGSAVATLVAAILDSHILTQPLNFYANQTVQAATLESPIVLPAAGLSALAAPAAYSANGTVQIVQPTGLLTQAVTVPKVYANQQGLNVRLGQGTATLFLYTVESILVASDVGGDSVLAALATIAAA